MKKQSFAKGAGLLAVAIALGKIFSAVFKIPLDSYFLHADGMAIFNSAYNVYMLFFAIATAGIPLAISSLIASSASLEEEHTILSTSVIFIQGILCVAGIVIYIFAPHIATLTGMPEATNAFRVMSPALLFCGIGASLRGYFQGKRIMTPSALGQVTDSFGRLLLGFILVFIFMNAPVASAAAAAISGVPFGAFVSALLLFIAFIKTGSSFKFSFSSKVLGKLLLLSMPITLTASMHQISNIIDTFTVVPFLSYLSVPDAQDAFGCLSRAAMLYALPVSIASAVSSSILPAVAENEKTGNIQALKNESSLAVRLSLAVSIPCMAGFIAISQGIFDLLYDDTLNHLTVAFIAPSAVFLSVGSVLSCILQGVGKTKATVISAFISLIGKVILNILLMSFMGINGAALSTSLAYFIFMLVLLIFTIKLTPVRFKASNTLFKPLLCALSCYLAAFFTSLFLPSYISIIVAALCYIPLIFITGFITKEEFSQIFSGRKKA